MKCVKLKEVYIICLFFFFYIILQRKLQYNMISWTSHLKIHLVAVLELCQLLFPTSKSNFPLDKDEKFF